MKRIYIILSALLLIYSCNKEKPDLSPHAEFLALVKIVTTGIGVQFKDISSKDPASWNWNFGEGGTSNLQNPIYVYKKPGIFAVSLTVTNNYGSNTNTKSDYLTVIDINSNLNKDITFNSSLTYDTLRDIDGNIYKTIQIHNQKWMAENLKTTSLNDSTSIPLGTSSGYWMSPSAPAYCWYGDDIKNRDNYGAMYNWLTVNTGKLCPTGWHVPTDDDWVQLYAYNLGGFDVAGGKMKETGSKHWLTPNLGATNESGFTALPGGWAGDVHLNFQYIHYFGVWWSASETSAAEASAWFTDYSKSSIGLVSDPKVTGLSVRCLKDN